MSEAGKSRIRLAMVLVVATFVQIAFGNGMRIDSVAPDLLGLVAICAGLAGGTELGAVMGFLAGLAADLFLTDTPFGLTALTLCLVGAGVGAVRANVLGEGWLLIPFIAFAATLVSVIGFVALAALVGQNQLAHEGNWLVQVAFIESVDAAVLSLPVAWVVQWAAGTTGARHQYHPSAGVVV